MRINNKTKNLIAIMMAVITVFLIVACSTPNVKLTFNTNGGTQVDLTEVKQSEIISEPETIREGYTFNGWYLTSEFDESSKFTFEDPIIRNMTFYAKWTINSYTVEFVTNTDDELSSITLNYNETITIDEISKEGHYFAGWYENINLEDDFFNQGKMPARDLVLYAKWEREEYTITFYLNEVDTIEKTVLYGEDLTDIPKITEVVGKNRYWDHTDFTNITEDMEVRILEDDKYYEVVIKDEFGKTYETLSVKHGNTYEPIITPTREGYIFEGYSVSTSQPITDNIEVLVVYKRITFLVIFEMPEGQITQNVNYGEDAVAPVYIAEPGYTFDGWDTDFTNVLEELVIKAIRTPITYQITLDANSGIFTNSSNLLIIDKQYREEIGLIEIPTRLGYVFNGWSLDGVAYIISPGQRMEIGDLDLTAEWSLQNYNINYHNIDGLSHSNPDKYTISSDEITLANPTNKIGYTFDGWYSTSEYLDKVETIESGQTGDINLYAKFNIINYNITYNNVGEEEHSNPNSYNIESTTITLTPATRTGYTFMGWYKTSEYLDQVETIELGTTGNITLHAKWEANSYTISFDTKGGETLDDLVVTYNQIFTLPTPTYPGYTFVEWLLDGNQFAGNTEWLLTNNITLTADYSVVQYDITYNNVGEVEHSNPNSYDVETTTITLTPAIRTGYTFMGWYKTSEYLDKVEIIELGTTGNITLHAKWEANSYTISFDTKGGEILPGLVVTYNVLFTLPTPTYPGYTFVEWLLDGDQFAGNTEWLLTNNITLTADYSVVQYDITYNNVGEEEHSNPNSYNVESTTITLTPATRTGYTFMGWYSTNDYLDKVETIELGTTGNITLHAKWEANSYTIIFDTNGGAPLADLSVIFGGAYNLQTTTYTGYTFVRWENDNNLFPQTGTWNVPSDITLVAVWSEWPAISFNTQGGSSMSPISVEPGSQVEAPTESPVKLGYEFEYWYLTDENIEYEFVLMPNEDIVLNAKYSLVDYTISYEDLMGQTNPNNLSYTIETPTFNLVDLDAVNGYTFMGWYKTSEYLDKVETIELGTTGHITLHAKWEANSYTISFDTKGGEILPGLVVTYNVLFTLPTPTYPGYTFVEWLLDGDQFAGNTEWLLTNNITLTADYSVVQYDITYNNVGEAEHSNPNSYNVESTTITLTPAIRTGYTFMGWYSTNDYLDKVETIELGTTGNITLHAKWEANSYTISFDTKGGEILADLVVTYNELFILLTPTYPGYTFVRWENDNNSFPQTGTWNVPSDITLTATYNPLVYNINYYNVENLTNNNPQTYTILDEVILTPASSHPGYQFIGWFDSNIGGNKVEIIEVGTLENINLYARFELIEYEITYLNLEGASNTLNPQTITIESNVLLLEPSIRTGYRFLGWFSTENSTSQVLEIIEGTTNNLTLYARWEVAYYNVDVTIVFNSHTITENHQVVSETSSFVADYNINTGLHLHGTQINPVYTIEGYTFSHIEYNNIPYYDIDWMITVIDDINYNDLKVIYNRNYYEVIFVQNLNLEDNEYQRDTLFVHHGDDILNEYFPSLNPFSNITAIWERSEVINVVSLTTVSVLYFDNSVQTMSFRDGQSIIYIASIKELDTELFIGEDSVLWNLSRYGQRFNGWFYKVNNVEYELTKGDYAFNNSLFNAESIQFYTKWAQLKTFNQVQNIEVLIDKNNDDITITWELDVTGFDTNELNNLLFDIYVDQVLIENYTTTYTYTGNLFTLHIISASSDYQLFEEMASAGSHRIEIQSVTGDESIVMSGEISEEHNYTITSIFDTPPTSEDVYDYFIIEEYQNDTIRYVFYTNMVYQFNQNYKFEIIEGIQLVTLTNDYTISINNITGSFKFSITNNNITTTYDALVIKDLKQFAYGSNYSQYQQEVNATTTSYIEHSNTYKVGSNNAFYLDLRMTNSIGNRINLGDVLLNYEIYVGDESNNYSLLQGAELDNHVTLEANNRIKFSELANGRTYKILVSPKYQSNKMTVAPLEYIFEVHEGENVFNHLELKNAYESMSIQKIYLHTNIKPVLLSSQLNPDGSPINTTNGAGNVYNRSSEFSNDNLIIEGNYMTIDGTDLPYSNANSGSGSVGYAGAFEIINVQIGIFNYNVGNEGTPGNNKLTMNNLTVLGNTTVPSINFGGSAEEIILQERLMSINSGGFVAVIVRNGSSVLNNVQLKLSVIGLTTTAYGESVENVLNSVIINDIWANSVYAYGATKVLINNSQIGQSGGPAIHAVDIRAGGGISNPYIVIAENTTINNYISGEEAWFKAYGMSLLAIELKSSIESAVAGVGRTIIKTVTNPITGVDTEMLNLIMLTEPSSHAVTKDGNETITGGSEIKLEIDGVTLDRAWNYLSESGDLRVSANQFGSPVGQYSDSVGFMTLYNDIRPSVGSDGDAGNLAQLASFYNLTAQEALQSGGNPQTIENILTAYPRKIPKYFEVLTVIPLFGSGNSVVIIELQDLE